MATIPTEQPANATSSPIPLQPPISLPAPHSTAPTQSTPLQPIQPMPPTKPTQPTITMPTPTQNTVVTDTSSAVPTSHIKPESTTNTSNAPNPNPQTPNQTLTMHIPKSLPNPNDKDNRHRPKRTHRSAPTPSHRLLTLHHKPKMTESDICKYLRDCPTELIIECLVESSMKDSEIFNDFDKYAMTDPTKIRIFIRGLNYDTTKDTLAKAFEQFGTIVDATVIYDKQNNKSKGYGFITFSNSVEAAKACKLGQLEVDSRRTQISLATPLRNKPYHRDSDRSDRDHRRERRDRSRSRDRDNRRNSSHGYKGNRNRNSNHRSFTRGRNEGNSHRKHSRGGHGQRRESDRNKPSISPNQSRQNRGGYSAQTAPVAMTPMSGMYPFQYGYDPSAYAGMYAMVPQPNVSGVPQPPYAGVVYPQPYAGYNPYFAGK